MDSKQHSAMFKAKQMRPLRNAYVYPDEQCTCDFEEKAPLANLLEDPQHSHLEVPECLPAFCAPDCKELQGLNKIEGAL